MKARLGQDHHAPLVGVAARLGQQQIQRDAAHLHMLWFGQLYDLRAPGMGRGEDAFIELVAVVRVRGQDEPVHLRAVQEGLHTAGVVLMQVGQHQQVQPGAANSLQIVGGRVPGVVQTAAAAVHRHRTGPRPARPDGPVRRGWSAFRP